MIKKPALALFLTAAALAVHPLMPAHAADGRSARTISVSGSGEVVAVPDTALVTAGVLSEAVDAKTALAANSKAVANLFGALKAAGIEERDLQTRDFSVAPRYDRTERGAPNRIVGYQVSNQVAVRVRKLDRLGGLLDRMIAAGANQMNGIRFYVDKTEALTDDARRMAVADAHRKADLYAAEAGARIVRVLAIEEGGARAPQPVFRAMAMAEKSDSVPMARGEQTISASVSVTYEIE